jgi:hypothetical protein
MYDWAINHDPKIPKYEVSCQIFNKIISCTFLWHSHRTFLNFLTSTRLASSSVVYRVAPSR